MLVRLRPPRAGARRHSRRRRAGLIAARLLFVVAFAVVTLVSDPPSSWAVADIPTVINNLRDWIVGLLAGLATLFLTFGGLRYLMAGGDPGEVESAKRALKAAAIGYGLAIMAPVLVTVLQGIVGAGGGDGQ
ncbi:pilin [Streptomyces sp. NPDC001940]